jgi:hypothetical protein
MDEGDTINPDNQEQTQETVTSENQQKEETVQTETEQVQEIITPENQPAEEPVIISEPTASTMKHKSRGVQKGAKRNPYKKSNAHIEEATIIKDESTQKLDEFNNENIQYEEVKAEQPKASTATAPPIEPVIEVKQPEAVKVFVPKYNTDLFNGLFLIKIFDFVFPHVLKKILVLFGVKKAKQLKPALLKLDDDERGDFTDLADEVAPYIFGKIPPAILLTIFFGYTYSRKTMAALEKLPDE